MLSDQEGTKEKPGGLFDVPEDSSVSPSRSNSPDFRHGGTTCFVAFKRDFRFRFSVVFFPSLSLSDLSKTEGDAGTPQSARSGVSRRRSKPAKSDKYVLNFSYY